ncbi:MAG TPA: EamA family transporter [Syntrophobacteraceae bacterium]|nr:EamA family transporter [Syntrophobacteraceae bacterium]
MPLLLYGKLVATAVIWGGTFVAGRVLAQQMGPYSAAFLRFLVASACLGLFVLKSQGRLPRLKRRQILPALLLGLTGVFSYNVCFFSGLKTVTAGRASLIIATNPVFIALLASLLFREKLNCLRLVGIALSMTGAATVIGHGQPHLVIQGAFGRGELLILGSVASWVAYSLIGKVAMRDMSPLAAVTYSCVIGALALLPPAVMGGLWNDLRHSSLEAWLSILFLGLMGSALGFIWYYEGIKIIGPARAGVFINIVPLSSVLLAFLILHEPVDSSLLAGAALIITGVYLTNRTPGIRTA